MNHEVRGLRELLPVALASQRGHVGANLCGVMAKSVVPLFFGSRRHCVQKGIQRHLGVHDDFTVARQMHDQVWALTASL